MQEEQAQPKESKSADFLQMGNDSHSHQAEENVCRPYREKYRNALAYVLCIQGK